MASITRQRSGSLLVEHELQPASASRRVLLLPGFLATDVYYAELMASEKARAAGIHWIAANPPGFKGQPVPPGFDLSIEGYAALVESLTEDERIDLVVGHSLFANVLIEVAGRGRYTGPLMLISPSLYRNAEQSDTRTLDALSRIPGIGSATWLIAYQAISSVMKPYFKRSPDRLAEAATEAARTPRQIASRLLVAFFDYIDKHQDLVPRLIASRNPIHYVRGADDSIGFNDAARSRLAASDHVQIHDVPAAGHLVMVDRPDDLAALVIGALQSNVAPAA